MKVLPLFKDQEKFEPKVGSQSLEMENILVYYVDEEPPTFTMKNLSGGIIAVIVVVVLAVVIGLLVLVSSPKISLCRGRFCFFARSVSLPLFPAVLPQQAWQEEVQQNPGESGPFAPPPPLLSVASAVSDTVTLLSSNSKERWRPCEVFVLAAPALGACHFSPFN